MRLLIFIACLLCASTACRERPVSRYDWIIRNGSVYDGSGGPPYRADVAINADTIAFIGDLRNETGKNEIDATGLAVAPGFINMLSWAERSLLLDGRSMSDIKQGVTLEVFGEGYSPGPTRHIGQKKPDDFYTSLEEYFSLALKKGISPNIASFVGATSVRQYVLDQENRAPSPKELEQMKALVKAAMEQGAMGLGSSLIYAPANFASTEELIELSKVAAQYGGIYITHLRSESDFILSALDEAIRIGKEADIPVEIYHLKVNIPRNWNKLDKVIAKIDSARAGGMRLTANMYPYIASATGLTARIPTWAQAGGGKAMRARLRKREVREQVIHEMKNGIPFPNSDPSLVVLAGFRLDSLNKKYKGKRLDEVARLHGKLVDETTLDLVIRDKSRIEAIYYLQSEENLRKIITLPFVSFGSDAGSLAPTETFADWGAHPRAYGTFARVLGRYVREENLLSLEEAIRRMTSLPATNLKIRKRGAIQPGNFADLAIFDPSKIIDRATFDQPQQYATGMHHVFVNGQIVLRSGEHTGAMPGRIVRGPGYKKRKPFAE